MLALASLFFVLISTMSWGRLLLYPFTLVASWVHEMGHGLAALCVGGGFGRLQVFLDATVLAHTAAPLGREGLVAMAGVMAPAIVGSSIIALSRGPTRARAVLLVLAAAMVLTSVLWVRDVTGLIMVPTVALMGAAIALKTGADTRRIFAQFVGLYVALDTPLRLDNALAVRVWWLDGMTTRPTDFVVLATHWGRSRFVWSLGASVVSVLLLALGLLIAWWRSGRSEPAMSDIAG
ncbi:MAG: M50 family metallopeptidase [Deltaproteobacteria bacterium]|nr:M50 family metallopeptidase [Deltaproteobacteria bacterium]